MQTVPSLVGTGTAIAAAATGLVFGQPTEPEPFTSRPFTREKPATSQQYSHGEYASGTLPVSRPGTSSVAPSPIDESQQYNTLPTQRSISRPPLSRYQRPLSSQYHSSHLPGSRHSFVKQADAVGAIVAEDNRDSISSNSSWIRRLSVRPLSQHGSPRSSVGPDSPSITFSHGSSAPILSPSRTIAPPLPPNKLVKRNASTREYDDTLVSRPRSRSHLPTLRRPATSHQRSATLQQYHPQLNLGSPIATPTAPSFEQQDQRRGSLRPPTAGRLPQSSEKTGWTSFFHSRTTDSSGRGTSSRLGELGSPLRSLGPRRIQAATGAHHSAHLVKPRMVSGASTASSFQAPPEDIQEEVDPPVAQLDCADSSPVTPARRAKRSFSMTFSSAGSWVSRTSGSLRRPKRGVEPKTGSKRTVSDPVTSLLYTDQDQYSANSLQESSHPDTARELHTSPLGPAINFQPVPRKGNSPSPLPPLPRLSSFHVDLPKLGSSSGATNHVTRLNQVSGSSTSSTAMSQYRASLNDRQSPAPSNHPEADARGFNSGDDDDTDFKSDTMFDSLRTVASSGRVRTVETPLESVYDESPPSTAGTSKNKRLSIQEILGKAWDGDNRIMEEDESLPTPIVSSFRNGGADSNHASYPRFSLETDTNDSLHPARDFGRLSMDDDFDDDWARDDDAPYNALSPPSKGSSLNANGINPNVRLALANISGNSVPETARHEGTSDRPLSHLFDWSEPSAHEKQEGSGRLSRPKTAYAKQEMDSRGGRSALRKGPIPTHVRSQSVPIVHDPTDETNKPAGAKYSTWGLSTKTVKEDWGDDFEFGGSTADNDGGSGGRLFSVPEAIQATQPSVKAHSGQIRELSLLVNDLKRLCRHGRDMDMLNGPQRGLWKEAEGIIALASPDEDSLDGENDASSFASDTFDAGDRLDDGFDSKSIEKIEAVFDGREATMSKTAVVRERHSSRRRSVFSPDDDIFGGGLPTATDTPKSDRPSRPRTPENRYQRSQDVTNIMRSVIETMQHKHVSEPSPHSSHANNRVHFDTNSLKSLVKRAGDLRDALSDLVRRADQITQSPARTPLRERHLDSSPAFTRVFDEPGSSPPRRTGRSRGATPLVDTTSPENSPSSTLARQLQLMTVN